MTVDQLIKELQKESMRGNGNKPVMFENLKEQGDLYISVDLVLTDSLKDRLVYEWKATGTVINKFSGEIVELS